MIQRLISFLLAAVTVAAAAPVNDHFADRTLITGSASFSTANFDATLEPGEPDPLAVGGGSIWYEWTVAASGTYEVRTGVRTAVIYVFRGDSLESLKLIGANDGYQGGGSRVVFSARAGDSLKIAIHEREHPDQFFYTVNFGLVSASSNDDFEDAIAIGSPLPVVVNGSNVGASLETGEADSFGEGGASVWYQWTADFTGRAVLSTAGSSYSTVMYVFTGSRLGFLDEEAAGFSNLEFNVVAGNRYWIAVHGEFGAQGALSLQLSELPALENDGFAGRILLDGALPLVVAGSNVGASLEDGEPEPLSRGGASVWYQWTAPASGAFTLDATGSELATVIYVFTGSALGNLSLVAGGEGSVGVTVVAGTTYQIAVHGFYGGQGTFEAVLSRDPPPGNDDFAARLPITDWLPVRVTGTNVNAGLEPGEPDPLGPGGSSVWYGWTPQESGEVVLSTAESGFSPLVYVFQGSGLETLSLVAGGSGKLRFSVTEGEGLVIAVHGLAASQGGLVMDLRMRMKPTNDDFADRQSLPVLLPVLLGGSNVDAGVEQGEPDPSGAGGASVWYEWKAPTTGTFRISSAGSSIPTRLYVFRGEVLNELQAVTPQTATADTWDFAAEVGQLFVVSVHGDDGIEGEIELGLNQLTGPLPTDYGTWAFDSGLSPFQMNPVSTPRGDGLSNLMKYAFNMDPLVSVQGEARMLAENGDSGLPRIRVNDGFLEIEFVRRMNALDVGYQVQFSSGLSAEDWQNAEGAPVSRTQVGDGWERVVFRDAVPVGTGGSRFGRVGVDYRPAF